MSKPTPPGALEERRKLFELLDRLATVDRHAAGRRLPDDFIAGQWLHGDADTRGRIEQEIEGLPKKST
jgi:hypothetical protein